jgi:acyl-CoA synthetase (AMP-forming)/AMP-acid ligase II
MRSSMLTLLNRPQLEAFYSQGFWQPDTIYSLARGHAERDPDRVAVREVDRSVTYGELIDAADRLAAELDGAGLVGGQRVAVWLPSRIETAVALLACSRQGYVCCPSLHRAHTVGEVAGLMERMRAAALIAEEGYGADSQAEDIWDKTAQLESLRTRVRLSPAGSAAATGVLLEMPQVVHELPVRDDPDSVVYLAFTSGTTGEPKGVMHSDNTLLAPARALSSDWSLGSDMVVYSLSPLSHNLGFGAMVMTLAGGGELVVHDLPRGASLVDRLVEAGATFVFGVPTHASDLLAELRQRGLTRLGEVRGFRVSGAAVPPVVAQGLMDCGVIPQSGYGMTEAGSHHYTLPDDDPENVVSTSGRACAGYEVRIFSSENPTVELGPGEVGQICGQGASLMLGYFDAQEATESSFNADGWFMTGDLGSRDEAGYLRITGRKKDLIIRGGHNIFPAHIENLMLRHPAVDKAAAIPVPDERLGEKVCLAVVFKDQMSLDDEALLDHLAAVGLSKFDMPEYLLRLDRMPIGPSGKIMKRDLLDAVDRGDLAVAPVRSTPVEQRSATSVGTDAAGEE